MLGIGTLVFSVALLGMGLATAYWHLVLCRMLIAAGEAVCRWDTDNTLVHLTPIFHTSDPSDTHLIELSPLPQADVWIPFGRPLSARVARPCQRHLLLGGLLGIRICLPSRHPGEQQSHFNISTYTFHAGHPVGHARLWLARTLPAGGPAWHPHCHPHHPHLEGAGEASHSCYDQLEQ